MKEKYIDVEAEMMRELDNRDSGKNFPHELEVRIKKFQKDIRLRSEQLAASCFNNFSERNLLKDVEVYPRDFDMRCIDED